MYQIMQPVDRSVIIVLQPFANCRVGHLDFLSGCFGVFAVATGMCLGKEGPFVHISTCVGYLVANRFSKCRNNGRKMREVLSVACAAGLSVGMFAP